MDNGGAVAAAAVAAGAVAEINNSTNNPACAACKHQRKRCDQKCFLAPYFPASRSKEFQAVHKVFGVSNVTKILRSVPVEDRKRAAESLMWEATSRQKDPVLGPFGEYCRLFEELNFLRNQCQLLLQEHNSNSMRGGVVSYNNVYGNNRDHHHPGNTTAQQDLSACAYSGYPEQHYLQNQNKVGRINKEQVLTGFRSAMLQQHQQNSMNALDMQYYQPAGHQFGGTMNGARR